LGTHPGCIYALHRRHYIYHHTHSFTFFSASTAIRAHTEQKSPTHCSRAHGGPPPPTVTLLSHRTPVGGRVIAPLVAGGRWFQPFEALARVHQLLQPSWQLLAMPLATGRALAILCPERAKSPAAEAGGTRGDVSRRGEEAKGAHAGDADRDASPAIQGLCVVRSTPAQRCRARLQRAPQPSGLSRLIAYRCDAHHATQPPEPAAHGVGEVFSSPRQRDEKRCAA
jgi:hypothetical protein